MQENVKEIIVMQGIQLLSIIHEEVTRSMLVDTLEKENELFTSRTTIFDLVLQMIKDGYLEEKESELGVARVGKPPRCSICPWLVTLPW